LIKQITKGGIKALGALFVGAKPPSQLVVYILCRLSLVALVALEQPSTFSGCQIPLWASVGLATRVSSLLKQM